MTTSITLSPTIDDRIHDFISQLSQQKHIKDIEKLSWDTGLIAPAQQQAITMLHLSKLVKICYNDSDSAINNCYVIFKS